MSAKQQERSARTWVWTVVALIFICLEVASRWRSVTWVWTAPNADRRAIQVGQGAFRVSRYTPYVWVREGWHVQPCPDAVFGWPQSASATPSLVSRLGVKKSDIPMYGNSTAVSLLYPAVLTSGPALLLWIIHVRALRRERLGHCRKCGYDLRGLSAGAACPECGEVALGSTGKVQTDANDENLAGGPAQEGVVHELPPSENCSTEGTPPHAAAPDAPSSPP
jgi:hypothetical protein